MKKLSVLVSDDVYKYLKERKKNNGVTISFQIEKAIKKEIKEMKKK